MTNTEKMFEKMLNMKMSKEEMFEQCRNVAHKPMTNEEWFANLTTEEKAEFLVKIELSAMHPVKRGSVDMEKFIEEVVEWLKQPHKE